MLKFADICKYLAARRCHDSGQTIKHLSKSAGVSESTVRRWIKITTPT